MVIGALRIYLTRIFSVEGITHQSQNDKKQVIFLSFEVDMACTLNYIDLKMTLEILLI